MNSNPSRSPFLVPNGETLSEAALNTGGNAMRLLLRSSNTEKCCAILENVTDPGTGPPLHLHEREDEWFYVVEGEFAIQVGSQVYRLKAGDSAFGPKAIPHAFECTSKEPGKLLTVFNPGGVEGFFIEFPKEGRPSDELVAKYGMRVVGPPMSEPFT